MSVASITSYISDEKIHCIFQSEIYELWDTIKYDDESIPVADSIWTLGNNNNAKVTRETGYTNLSEITIGTDAFIITQVALSYAVEFDAQIITTRYNDSFAQLGQSLNATTICQIIPSAVNIRDNNWHHYKLEIRDENLLVYVDNASTPIQLNYNSSYNPSNPIYFRFRTSESSITEINFKGFKVYSI